jgi:hypothetical protein
VFLVNRRRDRGLRADKLLAGLAVGPADGSALERPGGRLDRLD